MENTLANAIIVVRNALDEIEKTKQAADNYVAERQKVAAEVESQITVQKQILAELNAQVVVAKQREQAYADRVQKALAGLKQVV